MVAVDPSQSNYGNGMDRALWVYGILSVAAGILALLFVVENPAYQDDRGNLNRRDDYGSALKSYLKIFSQPDMLRTLFLFLIGLGVMNALTSMTDSVAGSIGAKDSDGLIGVAMIFGGVIGAVVVPALSDKYRKRKPFIVLCAALMIPGIVGLALVKNLNPYNYTWRVTEKPSGTDVTVRSDIPHPTFRPTVSGRYVFDFALASKRGGDELERRTVTIDAFQGQMMLLDGTERDDGIIGAIYIAALAAAFIFGFAVMSAGPLGFQYAAEVSHPAPEAASQGALLLVGQISGILFTAGMSMRKNLYLDLFLILFTLLSVIMLVLALKLRESPLIITEAEKYS
jgi:MFS family permease